MSRLITITPEINLEEEPEGYEFGYYVFEDLKPIQTSKERDHIMAIHQINLMMPYQVMLKLSGD